MTAGRPGRSTRTSGEVGITTFHQVTGMFAGLTVRRIPIASGSEATLATPVTVCQLTTATSSRQWTGNDDDNDDNDNDNDDRNNDQAPKCCPCAPAYGGGWWFYR